MVTVANTPSLHLVSDVDELTNLPNSDGVCRTVSQLIQDYPHRDLAMLFLDMDCFRAINEISGYQYGNEIIVAAADQLRAAIEPEDFLARLGSDKFIVVIPEVDGTQHVHRFISKITDAMMKLTEQEQPPVSLSFSIGVATYPQDGWDFQTLLRHANIAMYRAKDVGHCSCNFFNAGSEDIGRARGRNEIDSALRNAIHQEEFNLLYQPLINLNDGSLFGVEALLRWHSDKLGSVSPMDFIPIAESNRQIVEIGQWVMHEAFKQATEWADSGYRIKIAVNVSPIQLRDRSLINSIIEYRAKYPQAADLIEIEITETSWIRDMDTIINACQVLAEMGMSIAIDDFGTGYSSLAYLNRLPISKIKIDRAFVEGSTSTDAVKIMQNIISLGNDLRKTVVAEGVETSAQMRLLQKLGCHVAQGYFFSHPLNREDIPRIATQEHYRLLISRGTSAA